MAATNRWRFGALCVLAYVALSWSARFDMGLGLQIASLVYPLDTFSMYAGAPGDAISHLVVRDARGETHRVTDFAAYQCDDAVEREAARCADRPGFAYHYDDLARYIASHRGPGSMPVELLYRTWALRAGEPAQRETDCLVARCTVAP